MSVRRRASASRLSCEFMQASRVTSHCQKHCKHMCARESLTQLLASCLRLAQRGVSSAPMQPWSASASTAPFATPSSPARPLRRVRGRAGIGTAVKRTAAARCVGGDPETQRQSAFRQAKRTVGGGRSGQTVTCVRALPFAAGDAARTVHCSTGLLGRSRDAAVCCAASPGH